MVEVGDVVVDEAVASNFSDEGWEGEDGHYGYRLECLPYLHLDLVTEVFRVLKRCLVEDEVVAECRAEEVDNNAEQSAICVSKPPQINMGNSNLRRYEV